MPDMALLVDRSLISEAIPGLLDLKVSFWQEFDVIADGETIIGSKFSNFSIGAMAVATDRGDRFVGWYRTSPGSVIRGPRRPRWSSEIQITSVARSPTRPIFP